LSTSSTWFGNIGQFGHRVQGKRTNAPSSQWNNARREAVKTAVKHASNAIMLGCTEEAKFLLPVDEEEPVLPVLPVPPVPVPEVVGLPPLEEAAVEQPQAREVLGLAINPLQLLSGPAVPAPFRHSTDRVCVPAGQEQPFQAPLYQI
jgi:hypothetical protein